MEICKEIVCAVVSNVLCDCIYASSGKEENKSVCLLCLVDLRSMSKRIMSWSLSPGITLVLFMLRRLFVRNRSGMCAVVTTAIDRVMFCVSVGVSMTESCKWCLFICGIMGAARSMCGGTWDRQSSLCWGG